MMIGLLGTGISFSQNGSIEVEGPITLSDQNTSTSSEGMIKWNTRDKDFEGYNGSEWVSLTMPPAVDPKYANTQIYNDNLGSDNARLGTSVAIEGDFAFISAPRVNTGLNSLGAVQIYQFDGYKWNYHSTLTPDGDENSGFGYAVAVSENTLAISTVNLKENGTSAFCTPCRNSIYIYQYEQGHWIFKHKLLDPDDNLGYKFGFSLALDKDLLAVGTPDADISFNNNVGGVYVFEHDLIQDEWNQFGDIVSFSPNEGDNFGWSVALNETSLFVGIPNQERDGNLNQGGVYSFAKNADQYQLAQIIQLQQGKALDNFGYSIDAKDDILAIGAIGRSTSSASFAGTVSIFKTTSNGLWTLCEEIEHPNPNITDSFGTSISLRGDYILIGAPGTESHGSNIDHGSAVLYKIIGSRWIFEEEIFDSELIENAHSGSSVALGDNHLIIGAPRAFETSNFHSAGKAFITPINQ